MANPEHLEILKQGAEVWNEWRRENFSIRPGLHHADLNSANLSNANLSNADLSYVNLSNATLNHANLNNARLNHANLNNARLNHARLSNANLLIANLNHADLSNADLCNANFSDGFLFSADFRNANLIGTDFTNTKLGLTSFTDTDLSQAKGLETVLHHAPSTIGIDTLYKSAGKIPESFLRGCGVPDDFITFVPSHFGIQQAIQFYSCFISYSTKDEEFARRLYSRMRDENLRVWFAPEHIKGGQKIHEQIERAIQLHDRLLVVLSEESMQSEWVITEIQRARKTEIAENRRKLFPITIVDFDKVKAWRCPDADSGKDLAREVREYYIPDFSDWKDHDAFSKAFDRLLRDLKAEK